MGFSHVKSNIQDECSTVHIVMDYIFLLRGEKCSGTAILVLAVTTSKVCWGQVVLPI